MKRVTLRAKDTKRLLRGFLEEYPWISGIDAHSRVEAVQLDTLRLFYVNGFPLILETQRRNIPTLISKDALKGIPMVTVDMGAIPFVIKGADIMRPGISDIDAGINKGDWVVIVDENHKKPLAIGEALMDSEDLKSSKSGKVIRNLHFVGDDIWNLCD